MTEAGKTCGKSFDECTKAIAEHLVVPTESAKEKAHVCVTGQSCPCED